MSQDAWAALADPFVEGAYASVKGQIRTFVLHAQLLRHLPHPPAAVLDVGGGAAHQSLPLARLGYNVTVLDPSPTMLEKARQRVSAEPEEAGSGFGSSRHLASRPRRRPTASASRRSSAMAS